MRKRATEESMVESGDVTLPAEEEISDETGVNVLLPDLDPQRTYKVMSPRLAHPEQAKDFVKQVIDET
jgi:hypothetical protein